MAQVDFTNARITPYGTTNPTANSYLGLNGKRLNNSSGNPINDMSTATYTLLKNEQKQFVYLYSGSFTESGTEFYDAYMTFKVSNISFSSGDTYVFSIKADLICQ